MAGVVRSHTPAEASSVPSPACRGGLGRGLSDVSLAATFVETLQTRLRASAAARAGGTRPLPTTSPQAGEGAGPSREAIGERNEGLP
jgi:hypothetical protein